MRPDIKSEIRFFRFFMPWCAIHPDRNEKGRRSPFQEGMSLPAFFAYRAGKVLRLHFSNGEAAASGLVDTGNGHKGLGIDLCDQIAELV